MNRIPPGLACIFALVLATAACPAVAQTLVFGNLGPGNSYSAGSVWGVRGPTNTTESFRKIAAPFTPATTTTFGSARLGIQWGSGSPNQFKLRLTNSISGKPGTVLETIQMSNLPSTRQLVTATALGSTVLSAGTPYWLVAEADEGDPTFYWFQNNTGDTGVATTQWNIPSWIASSAATTPAFEIYSAPSSVPEPSAVLLFLPAICLVALSQRRKHQSIPG